MRACIQAEAFPIGLPSTSSSFSAVAIFTDRFVVRVMRTVGDVCLFVFTVGQGHRSEFKVTGGMYFR